jgi:hypothetical protein
VTVDAEDPAARPDGVNQPAPQASRAGGGGTALTIGGWILAGLGGLLLLVGVALVAVHLTQRDNDGYYTSSTVQLAAPGYAIRAEALHIGDLPSVASDVVGTVRVRATSRTGQALFIGIAPQDAVNRYLAGVARSEVTDVNGNTVTYKMHPGKAPIGAPARESFWQSASSGSGQATATWKVRGGSWAIVLMDANGAPHVRAAVSVGAKTNVVLWVGLGFLIAGLVAGGVGGAILRSSRSR